MRSRLFVVLAALGSASCASPLAALPLAAAMQGPQTLAAPMEDGSVYVLAEGSRLTSNVTLRSMWRREASKACQGEYMVLSERDAQSQRGGVVGGRSYEGFVRCISPEGMGHDPDRVSKR
jgi:hypothetical protein